MTASSLFLIPKRQGSLGNVGIMGFVFTNFQTDNYGTSSAKIIIYHKKYLLLEIYLSRPTKSTDKKW